MCLYVVSGKKESERRTHGGACRAVVLESQPPMHLKLVSLVFDGTPKRLDLLCFLRSSRLEVRMSCSRPTRSQLCTAPKAFASFVRAAILIFPVASLVSWHVQWPIRSNSAIMSCRSIFVRLVVPEHVTLQSPEEVETFHTSLSYLGRL